MTEEPAEQKRLTFGDQMLIGFDKILIGDPVDPFFGKDDFHKMLEQKYDWDFDAALGRIDSKASGMLTHISMMVAIAAYVTAGADTSNIEKLVITAEMVFYLFLALCCVRVFVFQDVFRERDGQEKLTGGLHDWRNRRKVLLAAAYIDFTAKWLFVVTFIFALTLVAHVFL